MKISQKALVVLLVGLLLSAAAYAKGPANHQLGPTGLQGTISKTTAKVTKVEKGSSADGKITLKLAGNKRQEPRTDGMGMLADIPLEDFHIVAGTVKHVIEDKDSTYHSYHDPSGTIGAGITILANLNIKEGLQYTLDVLDMDSGKWGFKIRMVSSTLGKYGGNARSTLQKLNADPRLKDMEKGRFGRGWRTMVKTIEEDKNPRKLMSLQEAINYGKNKKKN